MKMNALILFGALLATPAVAIASASGRVAYVDQARVLRESKAAKAALAELQKALGEKQAAVNAEKAKVDGMKAELDKAGPTLPEAQKNAKAKEILDREAALQKMVAEARKAVGDADAASTKVVVDQMNAVLSKVARAKGFDMVVEKAGASVLFGTEAVDLTGEVIKAMDAQSK